MANHSSLLAWKISWTEEPGKLQSMGPQRVGHHWTHSISKPSLVHVVSWNIHLESMGHHGLQRKKKNIYIYIHIYILQIFHHLTLTYSLTISPIVSQLKVPVPHFTPWNHASRAHIGLLRSPVFPKTSNRSVHRTSNMYGKAWLISSHEITILSCWKGRLKSCGSVLSFYKHDSRVVGKDNDLTCVQPPSWILKNQNRNSASQRTTIFGYFVSCK